MRENSLRSTFQFLVYGTNYLLPFYSLINLYEVYLSKKFNNDAAETIHFMTSLNLSYQLSAVLINLLALVYCVFQKREYQFIRWASFLSVGILISLGVCVIHTQIIGNLFYYIFVISGGLLSSCQSIVDAMTLYFVEFYNDRAILFYSAGINISGSIHAILYIIISFIPSINMSNMALIYFISTALCLIGGIVLFSQNFPILNITETTPLTSSLSVLKSGREVIKYTICVFLNFVITMFIYPNFLLRPFNQSLLKDFYLFNATFVFLNFNVSALCGNIFALMFPTKNIFILYIILSLRLFICTPFSIVYQHDYIYFNYFTPHPIIFMSLYTTIIAITGFSSAFIASSCYYGAAKLAKSNKALSLRILNLFVSFGLCTGSILSYTIIKQIK